MTLLVSIVVPFYNEAEVLPAFFKELEASLRNVPFEYEIVAIDDGSHDDTFKLLSSLAASNPALRIAQLSRNFGHQVAVKAGIDLAGGDVVVTIDGDLQDPPSLIPDLAAKFQEGYDVVHAVRSQRSGEPPWRKFLIYTFYRALHSISRLPIQVDSGDYRLMSRRVADQIRGINDPLPYLRGLAIWVGFRQATVTYARSRRAAGQSKYSVFKLFHPGLEWCHLALACSSTPRLHYGLDCLAVRVPLCHRHGFLEVVL
jgi:dolichol-phosphate mannosyltransferase